jgi:GNAT superfamily N-acetyltransferase
VIRQATADDDQLVRELAAEFEREVPDELWGDHDADHSCDVAFLVDDVGIATLDRKSDRTWLLDLLYVRKRARGKGVGTELLRAAAEHVASQGGEVLALEVLESNGDARRLYERLGFTTSQRVLAAPVSSLTADDPAGPTFGVVHVQTDDVDKVTRDTAKALHADNAEVKATTGWVRVRSAATDADPERLKALARELSYTSASVVLAIGVERGAVVRYNLYDQGSDMDEYLSVPEFYGPLPPGDVYAMGANATVVARLTGADPHRVRDVARTASSTSELPPAQELYEHICDVMGVEA